HEPADDRPRGRVDRTDRRGDAIARPERAQVERVDGGDRGAHPVELHARQQAPADGEIDQPRTLENLEDEPAGLEAVSGEPGGVRVQVSPARWQKRRRSVRSKSQTFQPVRTSGSTDRTWARKRSRRLRSSGTTSAPATGWRPIISTRSPPAPAIARE